MTTKSKKAGENGPASESMEETEAAGSKEIPTEARETTNNLGGKNCTANNLKIDLINKQAVVFMHFCGVDSTCNWFLICIFIIPEWTGLLQRGQCGNRHEWHFVISGTSQRSTSECIYSHGKEP